MKKKIICLLMAMLVIVFAFASCGKGNDVPTEEQNESSVNYSGLNFTDIYGEQYNDIFKENKLTVVNLFGTWCSPCVREIPELAKLHENMKEKGVAVVGIVTDAYYNGQLQQDVVETAKSLCESANVTYPMLLPDETGFNGYIDAMQVFPQTLFIDSNGNVVKEVEGANSLEGWTTTVERVVSSLEK